ncbi:MAG: ParB/RepB/Spo0J family partition protein [bacterium]
MALGKGLGALISSTNKRPSVKMGRMDERAMKDQLWEIPISTISPNPKQPRKNFNPKELDELAVSIKEYGVLQPILVSEKDDGGYQIISGERRFRAAKIAELTSVPSIVKQLEDRQKLEVSLIENIQRENLRPLEEAFAYKRLMDEFGLKQQEVADKVGKARPTIANTIRLLDLPDKIKDALNEDKIGHSQARTLLGLKTKEEQLEMLSSMLGQKITNSELERAVSHKNFQKKNSSVRRDPNLIYLEDALRSSLNTKVMITQSRGRGKIIIEYYSPDEFSNIISKLKN